MEGYYKTINFLYWFYTLLALTRSIYVVQLALEKGMYFCDIIFHYQMFICWKVISKLKFWKQTLRKSWGSSTLS